MATGEPTIDVTIRLEPVDAARMDRIVQDLARLGLGRIARHERFSIVNGSIPADKVGSLRTVDGVASVREDQAYRAF
ncbi:hypothetical protein [Reyranella sp.]|uniref:hypothetical protein n=1 Tax=Reyranella sp. TaxID=1929291 RepID=UPI003D0BAB34